MNILHVNNTDLPGARFNGYNLQKYFNAHCIKTKQLVYEKLSDDDNVISFADRVDTLRVYKKFEYENSLQSLVYPYAHKIMNMIEFREADIVHYHLIHNYILSLYDLPELFSRKKTVWTIHDPWIFTGHCVHPMECKEYLSGCNKCDNLERYFPMLTDNAANMWSIKKQIFSQLDMDIVVASNWMKKIIEESPLTRSFKRVHVIPFGINLDLYKVDETRKATIRKERSISNDNIVLFFRADRSAFKGLHLITRMLDSLQTNKSITLVTVGEKGLLNKYRYKYKVIDYGWVNDEKILSDIYACADIFLMPSTAEAFGVMAIEAMASSVPVVVMEGTALPDVVNAPECGVVFARNNVSDFTAQVKCLIEDDKERKRRGELCRQLAESRYDEEKYFSSMLSLYKKIMEQ